MRKLAVLSQEERKRRFDGLRKNYAERREFKTLSVLFNNTNDSVQAELTALGFNTRH